MAQSPAAALVAAVLVLSVLVLAVPTGALAASESAPPATLTDRADPPGDPLGWENGYWHNESISVDQSDGLSATEREAFVSRSMARVERIRRLEFRSDVSVSVRSREEFAAGGSNTSARYDAWNNQVWEALLIVGEDTDANELLNSLYGGSVTGYYDSRTDAIVVVSDDDGEATIDNATLVHELTHALQDQYHNLSAPRYTGETQDGDLGAQGIVEGEAGYVETIYAQRCAGAWDCVAPPRGTSTTSPSNLGLYVTLYQPYSDGPAYVESLHEAGGWAAVNETMARPPNATEQTIHATNQTPTRIAFNDTARNGWETFSDIGENGSDTVGEASVFAGFWYQTRTHDASIVDLRNFGRASGPFDTYNYTDAASAGWAGDRVFPYRHNESAKAGYVWQTRWDTEADAREFAAAYVRALAAHDARLVEPSTYVVPEGPFADAFHIRRNGSRVRIVNGPTVADVRDIRPETVPSETPADIRTSTTALARPDNRTTTTTATTATTTTTVTTTTTTTARPTTVRSTTTTFGTTGSGPVPGFGVLSVLAALAALAGLLRRGR